MENKTTIKVLSLNMHCKGSEAHPVLNSDKPADTTVKTRAPKVRKMFSELALDIIGAQEFSSHWREYESIFADEYGFVGIPTKNTSEANYIFYLKEKFELVTSGTHWLAEGAPTESAKLLDAYFDRLFTYALLKIKENGKMILAANTHFDHIGEESRTESANIISKKLYELRDKFMSEYSLSALPTFVSGDYNATHLTQAYKNMLKYFDDSLLVSKEPTYILEETTSPGYSHYNSREDLPKNNHDIDHIFIKDCGSLKNELILTASDICPFGSFLSDHHGVLATLEF